jgi:hypothetical protein
VVVSYDPTIYRGAAAHYRYGGAAPGPYRVVTHGQSFHWTDEARVAEAVYDMLAPGGALALIVHTVEGRPAPASPGPPPIPHPEIKALVSKTSLFAPRFGAPRAIFAPGIPDLLRDSERVLSGYFSLLQHLPRPRGPRPRLADASIARQLLWPGG